MAKDLKVGEVVRLNSGSPDLTVTEATDFSVIVEWCNEIGEVRHMVCPPECFQRAQLDMGPVDKVAEAVPEK